MYFLWKDSPCGLIKISYEGIFDFVNYILRTGFRLYSITLKPSSNQADLTVVILDEDISPEIKEKIEKHLQKVLDPTGMKASIVWAMPERSFLQFIQNPYVWAATAACSAVIITAGFAGFFWTAFWGAAAWFAVRGLAVIAKKIGSA